MLGLVMWLHQVPLWMLFFASLAAYLYDTLLCFSCSISLWCSSLLFLQCIFMMFFFASLIYERTSQGEAPILFHLYSFTSSFCTSAITIVHGSDIIVFHLCPAHHLALHSLFLGHFHLDFCATHCHIIVLVLTSSYSLLIFVSLRLHMSCLQLNSTMSLCLKVQHMVWSTTTNNSTFVFTMIFHPSPASPNLKPIGNQVLGQ